MYKLDFLKVVKKMRAIIKNFIKTLVALFLVLSFGCPKTTEPSLVSSTDIVLIGGGIMSGTLGSMLTELEPNIRIEVFERLSGIALESSDAWNNAGTGHASYSELNYTPLTGNNIDIKKAIAVNAAFELSKEYWAHLVKNKYIADAQSFISHVPHMSFVWGEKNVAYLKQRYDALIAHAYFKGMEYSEDPEKIRSWAPLIMQKRDPRQKIAATRMIGGSDIDFGSLTRSLFSHILGSKNNKLYLNHEVTNIRRNKDQSWQITVRERNSNKKRAVNAKFIFIGAGGGALELLQKSGIDEARGLGGFPVGGAWLICNNQELINKHWAKVYGQAGIGAPPMSVPHLDTRVINGKKALLFGPFATFTTKFLKNGSWTDLFASINESNLVPMMQVGMHNLNLVSYLVGQVLMTKEERIQSLQEYIPDARIEDWQLARAGQRVQVIKKNSQGEGILQFGTELVSSKDNTLVALLGASPGASTAVKIMLDVLEQSFQDKLKTNSWQQKLRIMLPSYGVNLEQNEKLLMRIRQENADALGLMPAGFLMPDITP